MFPVGVFVCAWKLLSLFVGVDTDLLRMGEKKNWQCSVRTSDREQNIQMKARPIRKCLVIFLSSLATHAPQKSGLL